MKIKNADKSLFAETVADSDSAADNISVCQPIAKPNVVCQGGEKIKSIEQIRRKLIELHQHEDYFNKEVGNIDKQILLLQKRKTKLTKSISANMKFRNKLIEQL